MSFFTNVYPVLATRDAAAAADFWTSEMGFEVVFAVDWYVSLRRGQHELAVLDCHHPTIPVASRGRPSEGVLVNVEYDTVADLEREHARLVVDGSHEPVLSLRSEDFGQRHFIVGAHDGVLVDLIAPIEPSQEYAAAYS